MPKGLMLVMTNVSDPAGEDDFNQWYDNVHLSDVLETPGIKKATRYQLATGRVREGRGKYLAIYEIEADDLAAVMDKINETLDRREAEGSLKLHPLLQLAAMGIYEQIGEPRVEK